jgi:hypothetical protein
MKKTLLIVGTSIAVALTNVSCTARLVDFTVISTKNVNLGFKKSEGKKVVGKSIGFLGIGVDIKTAIDRALESAGPDYDLLVDGVLKQVTYPFFSGFQVEGIAINSSIKKAEMGEENFKKWCEQHNVIYKSDAESSVTKSK